MIFLSTRSDSPLFPFFLQRFDIFSLWNQNPVNEIVCRILVSQSAVLSLVHLRTKLSHPIRLLDDVAQCEKYAQFMQIGRLSWIEKALDNSGLVFSSRSLSPNGTEVIASVPMTRIDTLNSPPRMNGVDLVNTINDLFQGLQMAISLNSQTWTSPQNNVYKSVKFAFSSKHDPLVWADILTKFSGLTINVIKYDTNTNSWYYEGAIYVL